MRVFGDEKSLDVQVSGSYYARMSRTRDLQEFPQLEKDIAEAQEDLKKGRCTPLEKLLAKEGFGPHVSDRAKSKGKKIS